MNDDLDFMISTDGLHDKGNEIDKEILIIKEALLDIDSARKSLDGWVSQNKDKYDAKLANAMPKMYEMVELIKKFGEVANETSERAQSVEDKISMAIDNNSEV